MQESRAQSGAIRHKDGPMLVLAGPGSGKTFTITRRLACLIGNYGVSPDKILVITFTKAAAVQMQQRFMQLSERAAAVTFGTFHAVFFQILQDYYHYTPQSIIKENQKIALIRRLCRENGLDGRELPQMILKEISRVKNLGGTMDKAAGICISEACFLRIYQGYQEILENNGQLDFDDMLLKCHTLLRDRLQVRQRWQERFLYILIDEFQDINRLQYETVKLLAAPRDNLFAVGDDDQSIYSFRGACPQMMREFQRDFPACKVVLLSENYRCSGNIVTAAGCLISHNKERFPKDIKAAAAPGESVHSLLFDTREEEYAALCRLLEAQKSTEGTAIIVRTNGQAGRIGDMLAGRGIPFYSKERLPDIYSHFIAVDLFSYLKLAHGSRRRAELLSVLNRPDRGIGRECLAHEVFTFGDLLAFYRQDRKLCAQVKKLCLDLRSLAAMPPFAAVNYIEKAVGYGGFLENYAKREGIAPEKLRDVLAELKERARPYETFAQWQEAAVAYGEALRKDSSGKEKGVALMTMHGAKGLEFCTVYLPDVNEGFTPYRKAVTEDAMEEERRMFYVAMTRAKERLYLLAAKEDGGRTMMLSRFWEEQNKGKNQ